MHTTYYIMYLRNERHCPDSSGIAVLTFYMHMTYMYIMYIHIYGGTHDKMQTPGTL